MSTIRFDGEVAMITGGAHGMGRAYCLEFARRGAAVAIVDVDEAAANESAEQVRRLGVAALAVSNGGVPASSIVERCLEDLGRLDIVVNNAGISHEAPFVDDSPDVLERLLDVHLRLPMELVRAGWPDLVARHGRVVNVVSNAALFGKAGMTSYAASKGALVGWTRALALEAGPVGVRVNAVAPIAATRLTAGLLGDLHDRLTPDGVVPAVAWLAHRDCRENGQVISAAGGAVARIVAARVALGVADSVDGLPGLFDHAADLSTATSPASAAGEVAEVRTDLGA